MRYLIITVMTVVLFAACKENADILEFDNKNAYVYWAFPNNDRNPAEKYVDSVFYSFALDEEIGREQMILKIPVAIGGNAAAKDRKYSYTIDPKSDYDPTLLSFSDPIIKSGNFVDTLYITLKRGEVLSEKEMFVTLLLQDSEEFEVGHQYNRKIKIVFTDILTEPDWWSTWDTYLGPFYKEVLQQWMQIYYLGADPTPEIYDDIPPPYYYWNEMPPFFSTTSFPVTIMYLGELKKYFEENVVYPDGDTTKDRILLP